jgi:hypothetical protein
MTEWVRVPRSCAPEATEKAPTGYDVRAGAAAYAPIVGAIGGFVVPAVVLVFEIASRHHLIHGGRAEALLGAATALLVLGLISCLLGAFALGAIGAERSTTPSLVAAVLYAGAGTAVGVVAVLAAFEVLAALFFRDAEQPFAAITVGAAVAGVVLVALVLGDAWSAPVTDQDHWLRTRKECNRWASIFSVLGCVPIIGSAIAHFSHLGLHGEGAVFSVLVVIGICIAMAAGLGSMFRTIRGDDGREKPLERWEAASTIGILSVYLSVSILAMPF